MALTTMHSDSRRWDRIPVEMPVTLAVGSGPCNGAHDALALDLSWTGARVRGIAMALMSGQLINVVMSEGEVKHTKSARVVWVSEPESGKAGEAGIRFLHPLALDA